LKRYVLSLAAAFAVALASAGGALAKTHHHHAVPAQHAKAHHAGSHHAKAAKRKAPVGSLVPGFAPHPRAWLKAFSESPFNQTRPPNAKPAPKTKPAPKAKPAPKTKPAHPHVVKRQPHPLHPLRATTLSIYEHTAKRSVLVAQGCSAAQRHESGVVVLDFGKPAYEHGGYGTIVFSGRFATNHKITAAMLGYARGYVSCLPEGSTASIELARGTSNYHPSVPSAYVAGVRWARETNKLGHELDNHALSVHVEAAAADDAEPAWDRSFRRTRQFFHGFRAAVHGHTLFDYGSLDGGVGAIWSAKQAWYVAGGLRNTKALPEIYNSAMAQEWAELARIARGRYHRAVRFAGVMTQGTSSCNCGLRPDEAHRVLAQALSSQGIDQVVLPAGGTNIVG
jgi:hypothetical protein